MDAIVAMDRNMGIGKDNKMCWHIPDDFKHFKEVTDGSMVVMGRKTYESIGKSLPNRINVILTSNKNFKPYSDDDIVVWNFGQIDDVINGHDGKVFCIGGGTLYEHYIHTFEKIYVTWVTKIIDEPDTFFPRFLINGYKEYSPRPTKMVKDYNELDSVGLSEEEHYNTNILCTYHLFERQNFGITGELLKEFFNSNTLVPTKINFLGEVLFIIPSKCRSYINIEKTFRPHRNSSEGEDYIIGFTQEETDSDDDRTIVRRFISDDNEGEPNILTNKLVTISNYLKKPKNVSYDDIVSDFISVLYKTSYEISKVLGEN